jgi:hypothetical protein
MWRARCAGLSSARSKTRCPETLLTTKFSAGDSVLVELVHRQIKLTPIQKEREPKAETPEARAAAKGTRSRQRQGRTLRRSER